MNEPPGAGACRQSCEHGRTAMVNQIETARDEGSRGTDHRVAAVDQLGERRFVGDTGVDRRDLPNIAHRAEEAGAHRMGRRDRDDGAPRRQPLHDVAADEPGAADYGRPVDFSSRLSLYRRAFPDASVRNLRPRESEPLIDRPVMAL